MLAKVLQFLETTLYSRAKLRAEGSFSIMTKVEMAKDNQLQMGIYFYDPCIPDKRRSRHLLAKVLQFLETTLYSRAKLRAEGSFFYYDKS